MKIKQFLFSGLLLISTTAIAAPWKIGIQAYDINGKPYTGKAYINKMIWAEEDFENGNPVRILTDGCMRGSCERKEIINGIPYIRSREENGKPLNGIIKTEPQKEGNWTQLGQEGKYINGVPDGLHKQYDEKGMKGEIMYGQGKTLWEKHYDHVMPDSPYMTLKVDMQEIVYGDNLITTSYHNKGQKVLEIKKLPDERLAEISLYENGKILMRQRFRKNGTSQVENFIDKTKKDLAENQIYNLSKWSSGWKEGKPYDYKAYDATFDVVVGRRLVCRGIIGEPNQVQCLKDINTPVFNATSLSEEQEQLFYDNPKEFFAKNELGLDLSDVGEKNIRELNADTETQMNQFMQIMQTGLQGMMEGMAEGLGAETEEEFKETVRKKVEESFSTLTQ